MSNIEEVLIPLQPYVVGIRYQDGEPLVDALFTEGWILPEDNRIRRVKGDDEVNYHMILKNADGVGLDELLAYVKKTIKLNKDREEKHALLRAKAEELKALFKSNNLDRLKGLKFKFSDEPLVPTLSDIDVETEFDLEEEPQVTQPPVEQQPAPQEQQVAPVEQQQPSAPVAPAFLDSDGNPIEMTPEEMEEAREMAEEDARAERNLQIHNSRKTNQKVELPPR